MCPDFDSDTATQNGSDSHTPSGGFLSHHWKIGGVKYCKDCFEHRKEQELVEKVKTGMRVNVKFADGTCYNGTIFAVTLDTTNRTCKIKILYDADGEMEETDYPDKDIKLFNDGSSLRANIDSMNASLLHQQHQPPKTYSRSPSPLYDSQTRLPFTPKPKQVRDPKVDVQLFVTMRVNAQFVDGVWHEGNIVKIRKGVGGEVILIVITYDDGQREVINWPDNGVVLVEEMNGRKELLRKRAFAMGAEDGKLEKKHLAEDSAAIKRSCEEVERVDDESVDDENDPKYDGS